MATETTPESKAMRVCRDILIECLYPENVADQLYSADVITGNQLDDCTNPMWSRSHNARNLVGALERQVKLDPKSFHHAVAIFDREPAHKALVAKLRNAYDAAAPPPEEKEEEPDADEEPMEDIN